MEKSELRKEICSRLAMAEADALKEADQAIYAALLRQPRFAVARKIFCYASFELEINTWPLLQTILESGRDLAIPRIIGQGQMQARQVRSLDELQQQSFGIFAPPETSPALSAAEIDLIIVPGLAFDAARFRLGRGGGYYDRYLAHASGFKMALCYDLQIVESVPHAAHDIRMDMVLTQSRIF